MEHIPKILLIEDNDDDFEATVRSLKKNHFLNPIQRCRSGQDALNYFAKTAEYADGADEPLPDLVLLDLNMPGIDGRQVLQHIKSQEHLKHIPVVVLTTSSDPKDVDHCYSSGASTYIQKPVTLEALTEAIRTMKEYWFGVAILPSQGV